MINELYAALKLKANIVSLTDLLNHLAEVKVLNTSSFKAAVGYACLLPLSLTRRTCSPQRRGAILSNDFSMSGKIFPHYDTRSSSGSFSR